MRDLLYSQCWEDPRVLARTLDPKPGSEIISIASAGDNTLALLLSNPGRIIAVDCNPAQLHLLELKMQAMRHLSYDDFVAFLGARPSSSRVPLYASFRATLSADCRARWDGQVRAIRAGVIHAGRFERYLCLFRRFLLPLIHAPAHTKRLLAAASLEEQERFYHEVWDNRRWRLLFRVFFSRPVMSRLGRRREFFRYVGRRDLGAVLLGRTDFGLTQVPVRDNYFLEYMLTAGYRELHHVSPYLCRENFEYIRARLDRVELVHAGLGEYLSTRPGRSVDGFNLSDVFEYMSCRQTRATWQQVLAAARPGARVACWSLFVPLPMSVGAHSRIFSVSPENRGCDRTFFYDRAVGFEVR